MPTFTIRVDRRKASYDAIVAELETLASSVQHLEIAIVPADDYWQAPDLGAFRDFVPIATATHPAPEGLDYVAEVLLEAFGWLVDFQR